MNLSINFLAGKPVRFFTSQLASQRALAEALDVPLYVTYKMGAFDQYTTTTNSGYATGDGNNNVGGVQFMDRSETDSSSRGWVGWEDALLTMRAWNGVNLFIPHPTTASYNPWYPTPGGGIDINPAAQNAEGATISGDLDLEKELQLWLVHTLLSTRSSSVSGMEAFNPNVHFDELPDITDTLAGYASSGESDPLVTELRSQGADTSSALYKWLDYPRNGEVGQLTATFSDYTYQFSEVLTRDWVQMTYAQERYEEGQGAFRYQSDIAPVDEMNTGIDRYLDPAPFTEASEFNEFFDPEVKASGDTQVVERRMHFMNTLLSDEIKSLPNYDRVVVDQLGNSDGFSILADYASFWRFYQLSGGHQTTGNWN